MVGLQQRRRPWWLLLTLVMATLTLSNAALNATEKEALLTIRNEWKWNNTKALNWTAASDPCLNSWLGITCDPLGSHVITLNLSTVGVNGNMPEAIRNLSFLENLDVHGAGGARNLTLPVVTGDLAPLASLTSLKSLNVSGNLGGGPFPEVVFSLTTLVELRIDNCFLDASRLSPRIANLTNLQTLYLADNNFRGSFPTELWTLRGLRELSLGPNDFSSDIPAAIGNLVNLQMFNVHTCQIWGGIPSEIGALTRMTNLRLYENTITGRIPDSMKSMTQLKVLRLSQNYLSGDIPQWLWTLSNLTNLQIDKNSLTGTYPAELNPSLKIVKLYCNYLTGPSIPATPPNSTLNYKNWDVDENCFSGQVRHSPKVMCQQPSSNYSCDEYFPIIANGACPPCPENQQIYNSILCTCKPGDPERSNNTTTIIGEVIGAVVGILIIVVVMLGILWKRKKDHAKLVGRFDLQLAEELYDPNWQAPPGVQRFKLAELSNATGGFDEAHEIGAGGFGKVFVGNFKDGRTLAIKRASGTVSSSQGLAEFRNEVLLLSRLHHKNLVRLEGFCDESGLQILVYEFVRQGNLHAHLFRPLGSSKNLSWYNRLEIAVGVAQGLEYLHSFADPPVIHRDVKPSNILLDDNLVAKIADFGISRATDELATHVSTRPAGTAGYFDPQYFIRQQLTTASDVYGYGVVLLELVTGQRAIDRERVSEFNLVEWVKPKLREGGIEAIADPKLGDDYPKDLFQDMAELGLECSLFEKEYRPPMKTVVSILEPHLDNSVQPSPSQDYSSTWDSVESDFHMTGSRSTTGSTFDASSSDISKLSSALIRKPSLPSAR